MTVSSVAVIATTVEQIDHFEQKLAGGFNEHPDSASSVTTPAAAVDS